MENILFYRGFGIFFLWVAWSAFFFKLLYRRSRNYQFIHMPSILLFMTIGLLLGMIFLFLPLPLFSHLPFTIHLGPFFKTIILIAIPIDFLLSWRQWRFWKIDCAGLSKKEKKMKLYEPYTVEEIKFRKKLLYFSMVLNIIFAICFAYFMERIKHM
jgi:hypothetical protein